MIPIFRKIRKKMADDNKPAKYLRYAIGEIVLVVIGILIALSINNWNKQRSNANSEQIILNDLNAELKNNITSLEHVIQEHQKSFDAATEIMALIKDSIRLQKMTNENLGAITIAMNYNWTYNPKLGILNSTINSGKMELIQNKEIRYMLSSIQESIIDANESTNEIRTIRGNFYWPIIASNREVTDYKNITFERKKMFRDSQFIWYTIFIKAVRKEGLEEETELLKFLKNINKQIESEIKN